MSHVTPTGIKYHEGLPKVPEKLEQEVMEAERVAAEQAARRAKEAKAQAAADEAKAQALKDLTAKEVVAKLKADKVKPEIRALLAKYDKRKSVQDAL